MKKLKYVKLFENFESVKYPSSITVKLTDVWKNTHEIYNMPSEVELLDDGDSYYYIGNTKLTGFGGVYYFATRNGNQISIDGLDIQGAKDRSLSSPQSLTRPGGRFTSRDLDNSGLRRFPSGSCTLGEPNNADYEGELEVGMPEHRGYFKIVSIK